MIPFEGKDSYSTILHCGNKTCKKQILATIELNDNEIAASKGYLFYCCHECEVEHAKVEFAKFMKEQEMKGLI